MTGSVGGRTVGRALLVVAILVAALATVGGGPAQAGVTAIEARGSVNQVSATGALATTAIELLDASDVVVDTATTDSQGSILFRLVDAGTGYTVRQGASESDPVTVTDPDDVPPQSLYDGQTIHADALGLTLVGGEPQITDSGTFGYIETRDGTTLAALASLPPGKEEADGPFPVVVEYSGYAPSDPQASTPSPTQLAANLAGYAWVGVNMRGTACSGGAFDYFETLQRLDGYDAIEAVAAQDWVDPTGVGMIGISYPGNSQLFVADTLPPHLSAVAPLSVVVDTYRSTLYPGGILNSGFATEWAGDRDEAGLPAAEAYAQDRIADGDTVCEDNQLLRLQHVEIVPQLDPAAYYELARGDSLAPWTFLDDVDIPMFVAGTFQDEQTGGHWPTMLDDLDSADPLKVFMTNGTHTDPLGPAVAPHLIDFFDLYLKHEVPSSVISLLSLGPALYEVIYGAPGIQMQPRLWDQDLTYAQARAQYEAEPAITVLWENGATDEGGDCVGPAPASCGPQYPYPSFTSTHESWPPGNTPRSWFLQPDGGLRTTPTALSSSEPRSVASFEYDDSNGATTSYDGGGSEIWRTDATYDWQPQDEGASLSFLSRPFPNEVRFLGSASLDLWLRASAPDVDLQVTLSEVTPAGDEVYIQSGWLRASHRAEITGSTRLQPLHSHLEADAQPLPADEFVPARVEIFPFAHVIRPGSQLRATISGPGGDRPFWEFDPVDAPDGTQVDISMSDVGPSRLVMPWLNGADAPNQLPGCGSLRSQPCRSFEPSSAPTNVVGTSAAGGGQALVSWTPPADGTGDEGYQVVLQPGGSSVVAAPGETSIGVTTTNGLHTATVQALDGDGDGLVSSPSPTFDVVRFTDVPSSHPFWEDIEWMAEEGVTSGFPDGTYRPAGTVTRAAMSAFMYRLAESPAFTPPGSPSFSDVPSSHPFFAEIEWMAAEAITTGFPGGVFRPGHAVTRQSMSAFMYRLAESPAFTPPGSPSFSDVPSSHPFFADVEWMAAEAITTGFPGGVFRPSQSVTRQAMAAFMHRF